MAENSTREQIISYVESSIVGDINSIKTTLRKLPQYDDLKRYAQPQLPVAAIVGRLPQPVEKINGRAPGAANFFTSNLSIDITVYALANENPDTTVSNLADDIWAKIYSDQRLGSTLEDYVFGIVSTEFTDQVAYWEPYIAFRCTVTYRYKHYEGGI